MGIWNFNQWLRDFSGSEKKPNGKRRKKLDLPLRVELLEDRVVPATFIWTGQGGDSNWSTGANWQGGFAPNGSDIDLSFGSLALSNRRDTVNDLGGLIYDSITISASGYRISGDQINLGDPGVASSGNIVVNNGATNNDISANIQLGGFGGGNRQFVTVNTGSNLIISGSLSGTTGVEFTKEGGGTLTLGNDNSGFTGAIRINDNAGILIIANANALGDTTSATTVGTGATLQISDLGGSPLLETLRLNGLGIANEGALQNLSGSNTVAGDVILDSNVAIGGTGGTLTITGQVSDTGAGRDLTKEGTATIVLARDNTYRGITTINNGILRIQNNLALGAQIIGINDGTVVNQSITKVGTLQLEDVTGAGLVILDEELTLNGTGVTVGGNVLGALSNLAGLNEYAAPIIIGSPQPNGRSVNIGVEPAGTFIPSQLIISGVISSPNNGPGGAPYTLTKIRPGRLILDNANTYNGDTNINAGTVTIRDSRALGAVGTSVTNVANGATLQYEVDGLDGEARQFDPHGRDLGIDSVTGVDIRLAVSERLNLNGNGANGFGALHSVSGINRQIGTVTLQSSAGIGVNPDPTPNSDATYFTDDYSLTVEGDIASNLGLTFAKLGEGHMILPSNKSYFARTEIRQGWVTVRTDRALGGFVQGLGETAQPGTFVQNGAALHLRSLAPGGTINLRDNLTLAGTGIVHPNALISQQGAILNLDGINTLTGDIAVNGQVGFGVEVIDGNAVSELTSTGFIRDDNSVITVDVASSGFEAEDSNIVFTGSARGILSITYDFFFVPDRLTVYYPPRGEPGSQLLFDSGVVDGSQTVNIPFDGSASSIEIVINEGGTDPGTVWDYSATIIPDVRNGGIRKLGTKRLRLQGDATYTGLTTIEQGVVTVQHDTALGSSALGTTVFDGAAIELQEGITSTNGGIVAGIQVRGEALTIIGTGNTSVDGSLIRPLTVVNGDHMWRGPITLMNDVVVDVRANTRLNMYGNIDDASATAPAGLTKLGLGEMTLNGDNTYRGVTNISQGVVTILNGLALGAVDNGTVVSTGASLQIQGNITVAGENLTISGTGAGSVPSTVPIRWFAQGPAPIANGETPGNLDVSGRVTSVVVDPTDTNVIYISTAGGGAWKSKDAGLTWLPLLDRIVDSAGVPISAQTLFAGSISIAPVDANPVRAGAAYDPRTIYVGTGEGNNSFDSYYGRGVLRSTDSGDSWTLIAPVVGGVNLFDRKAINKIVVDPLNSDVIYVAVGEPGSGGASTGNNGIWRFNANDATQWVNLTAGVGSDDTAFLFSEFDDFTDVAVEVNDANSNVRIVVMGIGTATGATTDLLGPGGTRRTITGGVGTTGNNFRNGAYIALNVQTTGSAPIAWNEAGFTQQEDVTANGVTLRFPIAGNVKVALSNQIFIPGGDPDNFVAYAAISYPSTGVNTTFSSTFGFPGDRENRIRTVIRSNITWDAANGRYNIGAWTAVGGITATEYMSNLDAATSLNRGRGNYANAIAVDPTNSDLIYLGGVGGDLGNGILRVDTAAGGGILDIGAGPNGVGPHAYTHGFAFDSTGRLYAATDGGLFSLDNANPAMISWSERNGNLAISQFNAIATNPFDFNNAVGGTQSNGIAVYSGNSTWTQTDNGNVGRVVFDPANPLTVYSIVETPATTLLRRSDAGGAAGSWQTLVTLSNPPMSNITPTPAQSFDIAVDTIQSNRVLIGGPGNGLRESNTFGTNFVSLNAPISANRIALGVFQGTFTADPGFGLVTDLGANTYVPETIYITNGNQVAVTKNRGVSWQLRSTGLPNNISDIIVDPRNRDVAYVVSSNLDGNRVFMTINAGQTWTSITSNLPASMSVYSIAIDPRTGNPTNSPTGDLYVGTDLGVWVLRAGQTSWSRFGNGLPFVQVKDIELNLAQNTLNAGTYGRGLFTYYLPDVQANGGALRAVSGESVWTGNITMVGATNFGASGSQTQANGSGRALLNILGTISDDVSNANYAVNKIGGGTIVFSGKNTYSGLTTVQSGVLVSNNRNALGGSTNGTIVVSGAALELQANLDAEPITLNGDGFTFNGHFSGALRNSSNNNVYTGPITMGTNTTIGVDSGTQLTITNTITDGAGSLALTKELTGTLILGGSNTYDGLTNINQGALRATNNNSLGSGANGTRVLDGAQLQLAGGITLPENISASGTGIFGSGAILNVTDNNTISGTVSLTSLPGFSPTTTPPNFVSINVAGANDTLTVTGTVNQSGGTFGLDKIGAGRVTLATSNSYGGATNVRNGALRIQNGGGLGLTAQGTTVFSGAQLELDGSFTVGAELLNLNGNGISPANGGALQSVSGNSTYNGSVVLQTDSSIGGAAASSVTINGVVSDPGVANLTKVGENTVTLTNTNTYDGTTTVANGILGITNAGALGSGTAGTNVLSGGTLQVSGGITVTSEPLTLAGGGFNGIGALNNLSGTNNWSRQIDLAANVSLGSTAGRLNLDQPLSDGASVFNITKVGAGTVAYTGSTSNAYDGTTTVNEGTLLLDKSGGATNFTGNLIIGDNATGVGTVLLGQSNQIPDSTPVIVNSDGILSIGGQTETLGSLQVFDGVVTTGNAGTLNVNALSMTGGSVTAATSGTVVLTGNVTATSSTTGTAMILGPGTLDLGGTDRTFTVTDGMQRIDLQINAVISDQLGEGINKTGAGRLALGANNTFTGNTNITAGDVEVLGTVGNILLGGTTASVSGTGTTGTISGIPTTNGTIDAGLNGTGGTPGILNTDSLSLSSTTFFRVDLLGQTPGTQYDQVISSGAVSLNGARLTGTVGAINIGDQFTILQTTGSNITGRFAEPFGAGVAFIDGRKFDVDYTDPTRVVLTFINSAVTVGVVSSSNPATFGQTLTFTATVTPEPGAAASTVSGDVTFDLNGPTGLITQTLTLNANRQAVFNPALIFGSALPPGTYSLDVTYGGNSIFNGAATTLSPLQTVVASNTTTTLNINPSPANFGTPVTITATVAGQFPGAVPQGTVNFIINGGSAIPVTLVNGVATLTTSSLPRGNNTIAATYLGNDPTGGFNGSGRTSVVFINPPGTGGGGGGGGGGGVTVVDPLTKSLLAVGADGGAGHVKVIDTATGGEVLSIFAYSPGFLGGVRTALGDVNGDGNFDLITGTGTGSSHVKAIDIRTGAELYSFFAFPGFAGGVSVGAGDVNGDGFADMVVGSGFGSRPHVKVFSGRTGQEISSFFAFADGFIGGINVVVGDVNGDGFGDIIVGAAAGSTHVKIFDGRNFNELKSFFAFAPTNDGGVNVGVGDFNGDGLADVITSAATAVPHVRIFRGTDLAEQASFLAYPNVIPRGVRVAGVDANDDGISEVSVAQGFGGRVRRFNTAGGLLDETIPFFNEGIGVFVG